MRILDESKSAEVVKTAQTLLKQIREASDCPCQGCTLFSALSYILQEEGEAEGLDAMVVLNVLWRVSEHTIRAVPPKHQDELREGLRQSVEYGKQAYLGDDNIETSRSATDEEKAKMN